MLNLFVQAQIGLKNKSPGGRGDTRLARHVTLAGGLSFKLYRPALIDMKVF